jgi:hypothetical protein
MNSATQAHRFSQERNQIKESYDYTPDERREMYNELELRVLTYADTLDAPRKSDLFLVASGHHYCVPTLWEELVGLNRQALLSHATNAYLFNKKIQDIGSSDFSPSEQLELMYDLQNQIEAYAECIADDEMADLFLVAAGMYYLSGTVMGDIIETEH